jgi:AraC-like DNA-binding protein
MPGPLDAHPNPMTMALTFIPILEAARERGVDLESLLAREGLTPHILESRTSRVGTDVAARLVLDIEKALPGVAISLEAAPRRSLTSIGLIGLLLASCTTPREGLAVLTRFACLVHEGVTFELIEEGSGAALRPLPIGVPIVVPTQLELMFATFHSLCASITGVVRPPSEVCFVHPCRTASVSEYEQYFGCPVTFGADRYELRFPRAYLEVPFVGGSVEARDTLTQIAERALAMRPRIKSFIKSVRDNTAIAICDRDDSLISVAKRLGTSARTLQRRLAGEGVSYERLLDDLRKTMALNLLVDVHLPITRIAAMVGFANPSAFTRAFRRWTGKSPAEYRSLRAGDESASSVEVESSSARDLVA